MGGGTAHTSISVRPRVNRKYSNKCVKDIALPSGNVMLKKREEVSRVDVHNSGVREKSIR